MQKNGHKLLCIIPARGNSKRLQKKNILSLCGKPLLAYAIDAANKSNLFSEVCVSSEDDQILSIAEKSGASLPLKRPSLLSKDRCQVKDVCLHILNYLKERGGLTPAFAILLPTNPLRTEEDIKAAYDIFQRKNADYVMSVVPFTHPPQRAVCIRRGHLAPFFGVKYMKQTQLLDTLYRHDGSIIFARTNIFLKDKEFYGKKVIPYFMPPERSVDIDTRLDLDWAEFLRKRFNKNNKKNE